MSLQSSYYPLPVVKGTTAGTYAEGNAAAFKVGSDDIEITDSTKGIILKSPNNSRWRITINNDGTLSRAALALMALLSFATSGFAQVRDMATDTNGNVLTGRTNALTFSNALTFTNSLTADTTRTNIGLADYQVSSIFPSESDGTKKVRYPFGALPTGGPATTAISSNSISMLPFFIDKRVTNFQAVTMPVTGGSAVTIYVAIYSANTGYRTATLLESATTTNSTNTLNMNKYITFTNQGQTLDRGWYILSAFHVGPTAITNSGVNAFNNQQAILGGLTNTMNTYNPTALFCTNTGTNFPASLTNISTTASPSSLLWVLPYY